jgi:ubiquinone/menaquinone biosynthesis C-methylase UbiE
MGRKKSVVEETIHGVSATSVIVDEYDLFEQGYFDKLKMHGNDVASKGNWQKMYAYFIDKIFNIKGKNVLDLGCAMGAITSAFADYGANATGVDISKYAIEKSPFKNIKKVCSPAWDLSMVEPNSIDFVHSMFMMNYIPKNKIYIVMDQLNKVCKDGAIVFCVLNMDNEEKKISENETIFTKNFFDEIAAKFNMKCGVKAYYQKMFNLYIPGWEFMKKYNWKFLLYKVCKKG